MTEEIFRDDSYAKSCAATVVSVDDDGIELDRTVFYATGGGQPGDTGTLRMEDDREITITDTRKSRETGRHVHIVAEDAPALEVGDTVHAEIDWGRRHRLMRMHTALHLLCSVVEGGVTGGQIGESKSRLDFDLPDTALDKEAITAELNRLVEKDCPLSSTWITDAEMEANSDLVRTMSVKPPSGAGKVRLMEIEDVDLQPCGGTHVARTGEIGPLRIGKIENKGKHNRRINIHLVED